MKTKGDEGVPLLTDKAMDAGREGLEVAGAIVGDIAVNVVDVVARGDGEAGGDFINEAVQMDAREGREDTDVAMGIGAAGPVRALALVGQAGAQTRLEADWIVPIIIP